MVVVPGRRNGLVEEDERDDENFLFKENSLDIDLKANAPLHLHNLAFVVQLDDFNAFDLSLASEKLLKDLSNIPQEKKYNVVIGSTRWPFIRLSIYGSLKANGQSFGKATINGNGSLIGGLGGGSGGTVHIFLQ
ncbi:hypothetical protein REPUB_Repub06bG0078500 [Reevesia pubescens]